MNEANQFGSPLLLTRASLRKIFPKKSTSENSSKMTPGLLGEDPGLSRPVEMHSPGRETPSSAPTAANGRPKIWEILQSDGL